MARAPRTEPTVSKCLPRRCRAYVFRVFHALCVCVCGCVFRDAVFVVDFLAFFGLAPHVLLLSRGPVGRGLIRTVKMRLLGRGWWGEGCDYSMICGTPNTFVSSRTPDLIC